MQIEEVMQSIKKCLLQYSEIEIDAKIMESILQIAQIKTYKKGELILAVGEKYWQVGYVLKGVIRSYYLGKEGNDVTKHFHVENQFLMDESLVEYEKSICTYEALEDCEILVVSAKKLKEIILQNESLRMIYITCLEHGLRYKIARENSFLMMSATERYIEFKKEYPRLEKRVNQGYIATYLGIAPESLSRIRRILREEK